MPRTARRTEAVLWTAIALYVGVIYATLPVVPRLRAWMAGQYGPDVFTYLYAAFGCAVLGVFLFRTACLDKRGRIRAAVTLAAAAAAYWYYLSGMAYAIERIHFLEYGLLGALLLLAIRLRSAGGLAAWLALNAAYWLGLGDEAIQSLVAGRVGELRDGITNLIAAALGVALVWFAFLSSIPAPRASLAQQRAAPVFGCVSALATALFLWGVHGFGYELLTVDPGRVHTSLSRAALDSVNRGAESGRALSIYRDEARRHLFQREFYYGNVFAGAAGYRYRDCWKSLHENRVLEVYYPRFLDEFGGQLAADLLRPLDRDVARLAGSHTVRWSDPVVREVGADAERKNLIFASRVKETVITSFGPGDLAFYAALALAGLGYWWWLLGRTRESL